MKDQQWTNIKCQVGALVGPVHNRKCSELCILLCSNNPNAKIWYSIFAKFDIAKDING